MQAIERIRENIGAALSSFSKTEGFSDAEMDYLQSVNPKSMTEVLAHIDAQEARWREELAAYQLTVGNLRAQRKPMTDEQASKIVQEAAIDAAYRRDGTTSFRIVRAVEAAHGITRETK